MPTTWCGVGTRAARACRLVECLIHGAQVQGCLAVRAVPSRRTASDGRPAASMASGAWARGSRLACMLALPMLAAFGGGCREGASTGQAPEASGNAAVSDAPPKQPIGRIVAYVSADDAIAREVLAACAADTGIDVVAVFDTEATKSTGLENRLRAERDRPRADVFWSSEGFATARLAREGVLAPIPDAVLDGVPESRRDQGGRWISFSARARVVVWNTKSGLMAPASWWDLPESAGGTSALPIAIADPRFGTTRGHLAALAEVWGAGSVLSDGGEPEDADTLAGWLDRLRARGVLVLPGGNAATVDAVAAGEAAYGLTDSDDALAAMARGLPIAMALPPTGGKLASGSVAGGGTMLVPNTVGIVAGGPGALPLAERVVAWLASPRCEEILCKSASRNLPLDPSVACDPGFAEPEPLRFDLERATTRVTELAERAARRLREGGPG